jgi:release factor glutamine methyltransferase
MYEPREDSYLICSVVGKYAKGNVLDMGTGSGIIANEVLKNNVQKVVAVDIDPEVIEYVKKRFGNKVKCIQSDLFSDIHERFDIIFFNPPYLPYEHEQELKHTDLIGGKKGNEVVEKFLKEAPKFLNKEGKIILLLSSLTKRRGLFNRYIKKIITRKRLFFETLYVYELKLK